MMVLPKALDRGQATPEVRAALLEALCVVLSAMSRVGMVGASARLTDGPPAEFGAGAKGPLVKVWQSVVGAGQDGDFGPVTRAKTETWAKLLGFGARSSVTPAMWATAAGVTFRLEGPVVVLPDGQVVNVAQAAANVASALKP